MSKKVGIFKFKYENKFIGGVEEVFNVKYAHLLLLIMVVFLGKFYYLKFGECVFAG